MPPSTCSLLLLLLSLLPRGGSADCTDTFRTGRGDFVVDAKDSVQDGAALLGTVYVDSDVQCKSVCCAEPRCNMALFEAGAAGAADAADAENRTCVLFSCVYRNRFVCRFVNRARYLSYVREPVFQKYLGDPQRRGKLSPPIANAGRDIVVQPGEAVLLNGIESEALGGAKIIDYSWNLESGDQGVVMQGTDLPDQTNVTKLLPGLYVFKLTVTDSNSQTDEDEVKVQVLDLEQSSLFCLSPVKTGPCRAAFPRWFYNATNGSCQPFTFGGCNPNRNNYLSREDCTAACRGVTVSSERSIMLPSTVVCNSPCHPDQLICDGQCCLDRSLECDGEKHCTDGADETYCSKLNHTFSHLLSINIDPKEAQCTQSPHTGPCRASHTRWYYDPVRRKCSQFVYGGCNGNNNSFEKAETCSSTCDGVTDSSVFSRGMFERYEVKDGGEEDEGSGHVALAVILTVSILALLAIGAYCVLRSRKARSHEPVATDPAHVPLSQQDTHVYNSTTKPV